MSDDQEYDDIDDAPPPPPEDDSEGGGGGGAASAGHPDIITSAVGADGQLKATANAAPRVTSDVGGDDRTRPGANDSRQISAAGGGSGVRRRSSVIVAFKKIFSPTHDEAEREEHEQIQRAARPNFLQRSCFGCFCAPSGPPTIGDTTVNFEKAPPTSEPTDVPLLQLPAADHGDRICLVLDLDETLVHSSFNVVDNADFVIPLEMCGETHTVYVKKRPHVDVFLQTVAQFYEVVLFTASLSLYANPVTDLLDPNGNIHYRLFREDCVLIRGHYVKDLTKLGRPIERTIIVDNSPIAYALQPENAIPISSFVDEEFDTELQDVMDILMRAKGLKDVRNAYV